VSARASVVLGVSLALLAGARSASAQVSTPGGGGPGNGGTAGGLYGNDGASAGRAAILSLATRASGPEVDADVVGLCGRADGKVFWVRGLTGGAELAQEEAGQLTGGVLGVALIAQDAGWALDDMGALARLVHGSDLQVVARHPGGAQALALAPDAGHVATAGNDGVIRVWDTAGAQVAELEGHEGPVSALAWTEAGLWSAGWDGTVRAWSAKNRRFKADGRPTQVGPRELCAVAAGKGGAVVAGGFEGSILLVDTAKRRTSAWPARPNPELVRGLVASPDGTRALAVLPGECSVVLLTLTEQAAPLRWVQTLADGKPPSTVAWLPDGKTFLVGRFDGTLRGTQVPDVAAAPGAPRRAAAGADPTAAPPTVGTR
jgi:hypothetical protein